MSPKACNNDIVIFHFEEYAFTSQNLHLSISVLSHIFMV
jgi:hypothetical protein